MSVLDEIRKNYPTLAFLANDPEVGPLLRDAVDPNKGFSPTEFQARLYQTKWFKSRSTTQREMEILRRTDPGEYRARLQSNIAQVQSLATKMGMNLSSSQIRYAAEMNMNAGVEIGSPEFINGLRAFGQRQKAGKFVPGGDVAASVTKVREIANKQFYVPLDRNQAYHWGVELALGTKDEAAFRNMMMERAKSLYPHLKDLLTNGSSMEDIFSGHRAVIAEELDLSPETIDFTKQFKGVLHQIDPQTRKPRPMTLHEAQTLARKDDRWWGSSKGRQADAGMANTILQMFGKRA